MLIVQRLVALGKRLGLAASPTEISALARLRATLKGKTIVAKPKRGFFGPNQSTMALTATVKPYAELIEPISPDDSLLIQKNADRAPEFMRFHGIRCLSDGWTLLELDEAFEKWLISGKRDQYSDRDVIAILGAAFGQHCAQALEMEWVQIKDMDGETVGLRGIVIDVKTFPYSVVSKRITASEFGFFVPVFGTIQGMMNDPTADRRRA